MAFVLDAGMQGTTASYRWQIGPDTITTDNGVLEYAHAAEGDTQVTVSLLDGGGNALKTISLAQKVISLNAELEAMINTPDEVTPTVADPETSRELVNDVRAYIDEIAPRSADSESALNKLLFAVAYSMAMVVSPPGRSAHMEKLASALDEAAGVSFSDQAQNGMGICQVRPAVLGMYLSATPGGSDWLISRRIFPNDPDARGAMQTELNTALAQLDENKRIDLFNLLRFPRSNLKMTALLLEALREQFFPGQALPAILADKEKAKTLISQYEEGPFEPA